MNNPISAASAAGPSFGFEPFLADFQASRRDGDVENLDFGEVMTATLGVAEALFAYAPISFGGESVLKPVSQEDESAAGDAESGDAGQSFPVSPKRDFSVSPFFTDAPSALAIEKSLAGRNIGASPSPESFPTVATVSPSDSEAISLMPEAPDALTPDRVARSLSENAAPSGFFPEPTNFERVDLRTPPPVVTESPGNSAAPEETAPGASVSEVPVGDANGASKTLAPRRFPAESPSERKVPTDVVAKDELSSEPPNRKPMVVSDAGELAPESPNKERPPTSVNDTGGGDIPIRTGWPEFSMRDPGDVKPTEPPAVAEVVTEANEQKKTVARPESPSGDGEIASPDEPEQPSRRGQVMLTEEFLRERKKAADRSAPLTFGPEKRPPILLRPIRTFIETPPKTGPYPSALAENPGASQTQDDGGQRIVGVPDATVTPSVVSPVSSRSDEPDFPKLVSLPPNDAPAAPSDRDLPKSEKSSEIKEFTAQGEVADAPRQNTATEAKRAISVVQEPLGQPSPPGRATVVATAAQTKDLSRKAGATQEEAISFDVESGDAFGRSPTSDAPRVAADPAPRQSPSVAAALPPSLWPNLKADAPVRSLRFSISPEDLGEIDVSLTKDRHGNVNAELVATTTETYVELQRDVGRDLQAILENAGVDRVEVRLGADADAKQRNSDRQAERRLHETWSPIADVETASRAAEPAVAVGVVRRLLSLRI